MAGEGAEGCSVPLPSETCKLKLQQENLSQELTFETTTKPNAAVKAGNLYRFYTAVNGAVFQENSGCSS